jgi:hypothetical protein
MLAMGLLAACGESYTIESARLNLINAGGDSERELRNIASAFLAQEGFEDLGRDDEMIALLKRSRGPDAATDPLIERHERRRSYLNRDRRLTVEILDYSDGAAPKFDLGYTPRTRSFIEIRVNEARPGGASREAHEFYDRLVAALRARFGEAIVEMTKLPATDEAEYRRVTRANQIGGVISWSIAFLLGFSVTSAISLSLLARTSLPVLPRRIIFTLANTWFAAPVLLQAATILVVPAPNALAFPWMDPELYSRGEPFHQVSFLCAFVLCAAASFVVIRHRRKQSTPPPAGPGD